MTTFGPWQRGLAWLLCVSLALLPLSGCETPPRGNEPAVRLVALVIDGHRLGQPADYGSVSVTRAGTPLQAQPEMALQPGDRIATGARTHAVLRWASGSQAYLRPNSSATLGSLRSFIGELFVRVRGAFVVDTEFVRAGAKGTAYLVRTGYGGATRVTVFEGKVAVESLQGLWAPVLMGPGFTGVAYPRAPQPVQASPAELQATADWVKKIEELVPPPRATSSVGPALVFVGIAALLGLIFSGRDKDGGDTGSTSTNRIPGRN